MQKVMLTLMVMAAVSAQAARPDPRPIFMWPVDTTVTSGPKTTFSVDIDLSKTKAFKNGEPLILLTVITPDGGTYSLDSRPLHAGEKAYWQGKIPAKGGYVLRVISDNGSTSRGGQMLGPIQYKLTSDAQGSLKSE